MPVASVQRAQMIKVFLVHNVSMFACTGVVVEFFPVPPMIMRIGAAAS
jgi:hypothetical protein